MYIRALSLHEPFASLIACGHKTIETRVWSAGGNFWFLVCAAKKKLAKKYEVLWRDDYKGLPQPFPYGMVVALAHIGEVRPMVESDEVAACCPLYSHAKAWVLDRVVKIEPFPVTGSQGWFYVPVPGEVVEIIFGGGA